MSFSEIPIQFPNFFSGFLKLILKNVKEKKYYKRLFLFYSQK